MRERQPHHELTAFADAFAVRTDLAAVPLESPEEAALCIRLHRLVERADRLWHDRTRRSRTTLARRHLEAGIRRGDAEATAALDIA